MAPVPQPFRRLRFCPAAHGLRDAAYFAQVRVDGEAGTIAWPGGVDLAPEPLYEEARRKPVEPASSVR